MPDTRLLHHGRNCWRTGPAAEASFLVDAKDYFESLYVNLQRAEKTVYILGWDLDSRQALAPHLDPEGSRLGPFLDGLVRAKPALAIYVLCWDFDPIYMMQREAFLRVKMGWNTSGRLRFKYDDQHPVSASHHQKLVVIDDAVGYCGGLDLTSCRWDSDGHLPGDPRRKKPDGGLYAPFHDVQIQVRGDPAAWLGEICRERWQRATGERLEAPRGGAGAAAFLAGALPIFRPQVGIARTLPAFKHQREVREVERLFVDMIDGARDRIYIESQYFTSEAVAKALCRALARERAPEIVLVLPKQQDSWLAQHTMGALSTRFLGDLCRADGAADARQLFVCFPEDARLEGAQYVNVHAKVMIVDGVYCRVGSANLNNRSMGLDTECDVVIDASEDPAARAQIARFFGHLLGHHLGIDAAETLAAVQAHGSIRAAIAALNGKTAKTLEPFVCSDQLGAFHTAVLDMDVVDLAKPLSAERFVDEVVFRSRAARELTLSERVPQGLMLTLFFCVVLAFVRLLPGLTPESWLAGTPLPWFVLAFALGSLLFIPLNLLIVITACVLPTGRALLVILGGGLAGAALAYAAGARITSPARVWRRILRKPVLFFRHAHVAHSIVGVFFSRLFPVAPFAAVNLAAGRERLGVASFLVGTVLGLIPGSIAIVAFHRALVGLTERPGAGTVAQFCLLLALITAVFYAIDRRLGSRTRLAVTA